MSQYVVVVADRTKYYIRNSIFLSRCWFNVHEGRHRGHTQSGRRFLIYHATNSLLRFVVGRKNMPHAEASAVMTIIKAA